MLDRATVPAAGPGVKLDFAETCRAAPVTSRPAPDCQPGPAPGGRRTRTRPAVVSWGVVSFAGLWNGFFLASFYIQSQDQWVLTQALRGLVGRTDSQWGTIMALVVLMSVPVVLL